METVREYDPHANLQAKVAELSARMTRLEDAFYWHEHADDEPEAEPDRVGEREARE